jgi:hypothetical protein
MYAKSLEFWAEDLEDNERARRAVESQKIICNLPSETYRRDYDLFNVRLYENTPVINLYTYAGKYYSEGTTLALPPPEQSANNKAKAAVDTLASQIFSTNQRSRFTTVDATYKQRRRAREMQNFADGLAHELNLHRLRQRAGLDSCILESGVGVVQFYRDGDRVRAQRALATEFSINPMDGMIDGEPQTLYRRRPYPRARALLFAKTDKERETINRVKGIEAEAPGDYIEVFEAWHLPTAEGEEDGWHILGVDDPDVCLLSQPFNQDFHDCVFFSLEGRFATGWGLSLMTQARKLQMRINANDYRMERAHKLFHAGHLYVDKNTKLRKSTITNEIGTLWTGRGPNPPQQVLFNAVTDQFIAYIERDGQRIFENLGINLAASQGSSERGLDASAAAMREETAKSDQRNSVRQQRWEQFHLDCMRVALAKVRDIVLRNDKGQNRTSKGGYKVAMPGRHGLSVVDWRDVAMDEKDYVLEIKPASPVPTDPEGLVAFGERMVELKAWTPQELAGYMQDLDADGRVNRYMAQQRAFEKMYESMLYDDKFAAVPDEFTNYQLALQLGTEYLAQGEEDGCPEKHVERVRRYMKRCKANLAKTQQPPPGAAPPGPPQQQGAPLQAVA